MEKIFSSINEFSTQTKKDWIRKFENENFNIKKIQHSINDKLFDPIYFEEEISQKTTFHKNKKWNICVEINVTNVEQSNLDAINAISDGANTICFNLKSISITKKKIRLFIKRHKS